MWYDPLLELFPQDVSNERSQHGFLMRNKKNDLWFILSILPYLELRIQAHSVYALLELFFKISKISFGINLHYMYITHLSLFFFFSLLQVWRYSKIAVIVHVCILVVILLDYTVLTFHDLWFLFLHKVLKEKDIMNMVNVYVDGFVNWTCHNDFDSFIYIWQLNWVEKHSIIFETQHAYICAYI